MTEEVKETTAQQENPTPTEEEIQPGGSRRLDF